MYLSLALHGHGTCVTPSVSGMPTECTQGTNASKTDRQAGLAGALLGSAVGGDGVVRVRSADRGEMVVLCIVRAVCSGGDVIGVYEPIRVFLSDDTTA
jgi:hypothetical protein